MSHGSHRTTMMTNSPGWKIPLEDGLVMRSTTHDDASRLADYNTEQHSDPDEPREWMWHWTNDLVTKPHPGLSLDDVIIIEDTGNGKIVSSCAYFQHEWSYCGIPVPFGRPELVSTHPDYRNRGLIRRQFELMHRWGDERGHLVQGITGIPYYYRQFEYEMALDMSRGRSAPFAKLPSWNDDEKRIVGLRPAERADVPFIAQLHRAAEQRSLFTPHVTNDRVEYATFEPNPISQMASDSSIVQDEAGKSIGVVVYTVIPEFNLSRVYALEFTETAGFRLYTKPVLKCLKELLGSETNNGTKPTAQFAFEFFSAHPAHPFLGRDFMSSGKAYAWYMRVPDLPKLLTLIAPKLEERLIGTPFEGFSGEKILNFYRTGVTLKFEKGKLTSVEGINFPPRHKAMASLPDLTFLQLLFGRTTISDLRDILADAQCYSDEDVFLMNTLFPKMPSDTRMANI